MYALDYHHD